MSLGSVQGGKSGGGGTGQGSWRVLAGPRGPRGKTLSGACHRESPCRSLSQEQRCLPEFPSPTLGGLQWGLVQAEGNKAATHEDLGEREPSLTRFLQQACKVGVSICAADRRRGTLRGAGHKSDSGQSSFFHPGGLALPRRRNLGAVPRKHGGHKRMGPRPLGKDRAGNGARAKAKESGLAGHLLPLPETNRKSVPGAGQDRGQHERSALGPSSYY